MFPDPIQHMSAERARRHASLLVIIAAADGELVREEISAIESIMGASMLHPDLRNEVRRLLNQPPSLESLATEMTENDLRLALRDAVIVAASDGQCDASELKILNKIAIEAGLEEDNVKKLISWVEKGWKWMDDGLNKIGLVQK